MTGAISRDVFHIVLFHTKTLLQRTMSEIRAQVVTMRKSIVTAGLSSCRARCFGRAADGPLWAIPDNADLWPRSLPMTPMHQCAAGCLSVEERGAKYHGLAEEPQQVRGAILKTVTGSGGLFDSCATTYSRITCIQGFSDTYAGDSFAVRALGVAARRARFGF